MNPPVFPAPDPVGLPAPAGVIAVLLVATLPLHLVMMNLMLGGALTAAWAAWRARRAAESAVFHRDLARDLARLLPVVTSLAITLGVAPLLFLQVLYGQAFYTSSILMAWSWLAVVALLLVAYYAVYFFAFHPAARRAWLSPALGAALLLVIGFVFTNNMTLMLRPERWHSLYRSSEFGTHFNLDDPALVPRFLHFIIASLALTGLGVIQLGRRRLDESGRSMRSFGRRLFVVATHIQILVGLGFLFTLPLSVRELFLGGSPRDSVVLWSAVGVALAATLLVRFRPALAAAGILCVVFAMVFVRHRVREAALSPYHTIDALPVRPQYGPLLLFLVVLAIGAGVLVWMARRFFSPEVRRSGDPDDAPAASDILFPPCG